jgi:hypothetical protein
VVVTYVTRLHTINIKEKELKDIFFNCKKINIKKFKINEKIVFSKKSNYLFLFVFLKDSDLIIERYNNIRKEIEIQNKNYFHTLRKSFINEGIYLVEIF